MAPNAEKEKIDLEMPIEETKHFSKFYVIVELNLEKSKNAFFFFTFWLKKNFFPAGVIFLEHKYLINKYNSKNLFL